MRFNLPFDALPLKVATVFALAILGMLVYWAIWGFPEPWYGKGLGQSAECAKFEVGCARYLPPLRHDPVRPKPK